MNNFNIGKRNALAIKKILWKYGLGPINEDLGGTYSRTLKLELTTGKLTVTSPSKPDWEI